MDEEERMNTLPYSPENQRGGGGGCVVPFVIIIGGIAGFGMFLTHFV